MPINNTVSFHRWLAVDSNLNFNGLKAGLNAKLVEISKKQLDWVQRLDVVSQRESVETDGTEVDREDDFAREMSL